MMTTTMETTMETKMIMTKMMETIIMQTIMMETTMMETIMMETTMIKTKMIKTKMIMTKRKRAKSSCAGLCQTSGNTVRPAQKRWSSNCQKEYPMNLPVVMVITTLNMVMVKVIMMDG